MCVCRQAAITPAATTSSEATSIYYCAANTCIRKNKKQEGGCERQPTDIRTPPLSRRERDRTCWWLRWMLDPWRRLSPRNRPAARRPRSRAPLRTLPRLLSSCLREERLNLLVGGTVVCGCGLERLGSRLNFLAHVQPDETRRPRNGDSSEREKAS